MAIVIVSYKFQSAKEFSEIQFSGRCVTVKDLKEGIFNAKFKAKYGDYSRRKDGLCLGNDYDLSIIDSQTNTEYENEQQEIFGNSSVLLRRVPGGRVPGGGYQQLDTSPIQLKAAGQSYSSSITATKSSTVVSQSSTISKAATEEETDYLYDDDEFGGDVYAVPSKVVDAPPKNTMITPAFGSWSQAMASTLTSNSDGGWDSRKRKQPYPSLPPPGYVCHRCNKEGHFIYDCPTNGDPNYNNFKRMRPSTPSAATAVEGILSSVVSQSQSSSSSDMVVLPPELHCQLCRGVMRDAVLVKRCCLRSFCQGCIREHVKKSKTCACGAAANIDGGDGDFVPNVAVRKMISSILQRSSSSVGSNSCSTVIRT